MRNTSSTGHEIFDRIPDLWHQVVETMDEALFLVDLQRNIVYFNHRAEEITGYGADEVLGRHCLSGIRCPKCATSCGLFEHERLTDVEVELTRKDGTRVVALKNAVVLRDRDGVVVGGLETFRDISVLREQMTRCAEARRSAEEHGKTLEAVLGSISEGIVALDSKHRVVSVSRRAREILAIADESAAIGRPCDAVLGAALCSDGCPLELASVGGERPASRVANLTIGGREVRVAEGLSPMRDEAGRALGHLVILTEIPVDPLAGSLDAFHGMIGRSPAMTAVFDRIRQLQHSEVTVLITGESGTGKELAARAVHDTSLRAAGPFLAVNCAALPEGLLESEIFGHVKGAFTGATRDRHGRVELARAGTLFLDEIGELPLALQSKLLRLVQERRFERLGEERTRDADIRIVAATHRELAAEVAAGTFREDLYYRLKVVPLRMPALRDRGRDVQLIAARLLERHARGASRPGMFFTRAAMELVAAYSWPGNVRELVNMVEFVVALTRHDAVGPDDLPPEVAARVDARPAAGALPAPVQIPPLHAGPADEESALVLAALDRNGWHRLKTARELGVNRVTLYRTMRRLGLDGPRGQRRTKTAALLGVDDA